MTGDNIVERYGGLVRKVAWRFPVTIRMDRNDLVQAAWVGLLAGLTRLRGDENAYAQLAYLQMRARGAVQDALRLLNGTRGLNGFQETVSQEVSEVRWPMDSRVEGLGLDGFASKTAEDLYTRVLSRELRDMIRRMPRGCRQYHSGQDHEPQRRRPAQRLAWCLLRGLTLTEAAAELGIGQSRVSQLMDLELLPWLQQQFGVDCNKLEKVRWSQEPRGPSGQRKPNGSHVWGEMQRSFAQWQAQRAGQAVEVGVV